MWLIVVVNCSHNGLGWKAPQRLPSSNPLPTVELLTARSSTNTTTRVFLPKFLIITFTQCYLTFLPVKTKKKRFSFYHEQLNHLWHSCVLSVLDFLKFSVWEWRKTEQTVFQTGCWYEMPLCFHTVQCGCEHVLHAIAKRCNSVVALLSILKSSTLCLQTYGYLVALDRGILCTIKQPTCSDLISIYKTMRQNYWTLFVLM